MKFLSLIILAFVSLPILYPLHWFTSKHIERHQENTFQSIKEAELKPNFPDISSAQVVSAICDTLPVKTFSSNLEIFKDTSMYGFHVDLATSIYQNENGDISVFGYSVPEGSSDFNGYFFTTDDLGNINTGPNEQTISGVDNSFNFREIQITDISGNHIGFVGVGSNYGAGGLQNAVIKRFDLDGCYNWVREICVDTTGANVGKERLKNLIQDSNGDLVYIGEDQDATTSEWSAFVVKSNINGNVLQVKRIQADGRNSYGESITEVSLTSVPNAKYAIVGQYFPLGSVTVYIKFLDINLGQLGETYSFDFPNLGGFGSAVPIGITQLPNGDIAVGGMKEQKFTLMTFDSNNAKFFVYDISGGSESLVTMRKGSDGLYLGGTSGLATGNARTNDMPGIATLLKIDFDGNVIAARAYTDVDHYGSSINHIEIPDTNNLLMAGYGIQNAFEFDTISPDVSEFLDTWIAKTDRDGIVADCDCYDDLTVNVDTFNLTFQQIDGRITSKVCADLTFTGQCTPIDEIQNFCDQYEPAPVIEVSLILPNDSIVCNGTTCIDLTVDNFVDVTGLQFTISYDASVLNLSSFDASVGLPGVVTSNAPGTFTYSWTGITPTSLPDASSLVNLCFTSLMPGTSALSLSNLIALDQNSLPMSINGTDGQIEVKPDNIPPVIICPTDITVTIPTGQTSTPVTFPDPVATDNCNVIWVCDYTSGDNFPLGTTTVTCTATDDAGNLTQCSFLIEVTKCQDYNDGLVGNWYSNSDGCRGTNGVLISTSSPGPSNQSSDFFLRGRDLCGPSFLINNSDFSGDWTNNIGSCFCWDFRIFDDAQFSVHIPINTNVSIWNSTDPFDPRIGTQQRANFRTTLYTTEIAGWVKICAPIEFCLPSGNLPSNSYGDWDLIFPSAGNCNDWTSLLSNITHVTLGIDYYPRPAEIMGWDNFCFEDCDTLMAAEVACDSLLVLEDQIPGQPGQNCCYEFDLVNNLGGINFEKVEFRILTSSSSPQWKFDVFQTSGGFQIDNGYGNPDILKGVTFGGINIPVGNHTDVVKCCFSSPPGPIQTPVPLEVRWVQDLGTGLGNLVCRDTFYLDCSLISDSRCWSLVDTIVECNPDNESYTIKFKVKNESATETFDYILLSSLTPSYLNWNPTVLFFPGGLGPTQTSGWLSFTVNTPIYSNAPISVCFNITPVNTSGDYCCSKIEKACIEIDPCCDACEDVEILISADLNMNPNSCCYNIGILNNCAFNYFSKVEAEILTPGVTFMSHFDYTTDWITTYSVNNELHWTLGPSNPLGPLFPKGIFDPLFNICLTNVNHPNQVPQDLEIRWLAQDIDGNEFIACKDTIRTDCKPPSDSCLTLVNDTLICNGNGTYDYTFTMQNLSVPPHTATDIALIPVPPTSVLDYAPQSFPGPIASTGFGTFMTVITGNPGDLVKFYIRLFENTPPLPDQNKWCCYQKDTICLTLPSCDTCYADFTWVTDSCSLDVQFTDLSGGQNLNYFWDFDDPPNSTQQSPLHTYPATGNYNVTLTISDGLCTDQVVKTVTVFSDNVPPVARCIGVRNVDVTNGPVVVDPSDIDNGSSDDCAIVNMWLDRDDFDCGDACNDIVVKLYVEDCCGNIDSCQSIVRVEEFTPPVITCPQDVTINEGESTDPIDIGQATAIDTCSGVMALNYIDDLLGMCPDDYLIKRTWTARDSCRNTSSCTQLITVKCDSCCPVMAEYSIVSIDGCDITVIPNNIDSCERYDWWVREWNGTIPGSTICSSNDNGPGPFICTLPQNGDYYVCLTTIGFDNGIPCEDDTCMVITIDNCDSLSCCPVDASFSIDIMNCEATFFPDQVDTCVEYSWTISEWFNGHAAGIICEVNSVGGGPFSCTLPGNGDYIACLNVIGYENGIASCDDDSCILFTINDCDSCCTDFDLFCDNVESGFAYQLINCDTLCVQPKKPDSCYVVKWNWGDGSFTIAESWDYVCHQFPGNGEYEVCMIVSEMRDISDTCWTKSECQTVTIDCCACPIQDGDLDVTVTNCLIDFTPTGFDPNCDEMSWGLFYYFTPDPVASGIGLPVGPWSQIVTNNGFYILKLTVKRQDPFGVTCEKVLIKTIWVSDCTDCECPIDPLDTEVSVFQNCKKITLNASSLLTQCDTIYWSFGDGTGDVSSGPGSTVVHTYANTGSYTVKYKIARVLQNGNTCHVTDDLPIDVQCCPYNPGPGSGIIQNGNFTSGALQGILGKGGTIDNWESAFGSPLVQELDGCNDFVFTQIQTLNLENDGIRQKDVPFDQNTTYYFELCANQIGAKYNIDDGFKPLPIIVLIASSTDMDSSICVDDCEIIGYSSMFLESGFIKIGFPGWKPDNDFDQFIVASGWRASHDDESTIDTACLDNITYQFGLDNIRVYEVKDCETEINFLGFDNNALGSACLDIVDENNQQILEVTNIGDSGDDGVFIDFGLSDENVVRFENPVEISQELGSRLEITSYGQYINVEGEIHENTWLERNAVGNLNLFATNAKLGVDSFRVAVMENGSTVKAFDLPAGYLGELEGVTCCDPSEIRSDDYIHFEFASSFSFGGAQGTTLAISPIGIGRFLGVSHLSIKGAGLVGGKMRIVAEEANYITSTSKPKQEPWDLILYPNPTNQKLYVDFRTALTEDVYLRVLDINGKQVWEQDILRNTDRVQLETSNWAPGMYIVLLRTEHGDMFSRKFIRRGN